VPDGYITALVVLKGAVRVNGSEAVEAAEVGRFDRAGKRICIDCAKDANALLLCGETIDEPLVGYGPFVMNSPQEIRQVVADYQSGTMGHIVESASKSWGQAASATTCSTAIIGIQSCFQ
jgi:quercetin 2,3-dioxygenase